MNDAIASDGPRVEYATARDREELLAFLLAVFRRDRPTHPPFEDIYPDLFLPDDEVMGRHAVIRQNGRIVSCVGIYLIPMQIGPVRVMTAGVGQVSTDADWLGRGFMTRLLRHQLARAREEGAAVAWLGGRRDRYSRFGFDIAGLNFDHCIDAHSLGDVARSRTISKEVATEPDAITPEMFALRDRTVQSAIVPLETYRLQMHRSGFAPEIWTVTPQGGGEPDAWALFDAGQRRILEWCGTFDGRIEILAEACAGGRVSRAEPPRGDPTMCDFLREHCTWFGPNVAHLAVLDKARLLEALAPFVPAGFAPRATEGPALVRELFGPGPGSAFLPFFIPSLFHV